MTTAAIYRLRYFFDAGSGTCLWAANAAARVRWGYPIAVDNLPVPAAVRAEARRVTDRWDTAYDWDDPAGPSPWGPDDYLAWAARRRHCLPRYGGTWGPPLTSRMHPTPPRTAGLLRTTAQVDPYAISLAGGERTISETTHQASITPEKKCYGTHGRRAADGALERGALVGEGTGDGRVSIPRRPDGVRRRSDR
jgi:hypothetical protein